ncbi:hypothetical protein A6U87_25815 [Rhizobium sp. AC44/96]|jgi:hypothetical protein|uniref:hypothetical protein n=1 Tax=unclassified Rhizobium TaxID=2613769 RepID=UPI00080F87A6|nr:MULTISPECIES: hypothetical protein [unclassified Rhizobium]MDM9623398.1 hypothetical protein [Rhizobium sp. S96]OCJ14381.1 hypothetical protein A6U87_25815 [Rhizobium sp. AC44/96]
MSTHDHNPLLGLYGTPRSVIHSRVSSRSSKTVTPVSEQEDPEKIGSSMISLTSLKDQSTTSR